MESHWREDIQFLYHGNSLKVRNEILNPAVAKDKITKRAVPILFIYLFILVQMILLLFKSLYREFLSLLHF